MKQEIAARYNIQFELAVRYNNRIMIMTLDFFLCIKLCLKKLLVNKRVAHNHMKNEMMLAENVLKLKLEIYLSIYV